MIRRIIELPSLEWENNFPRFVVLLSSTDPVGVNTLRIIGRHPDLFQVVALAGGRNVERLIEQAFRWHPLYLGIQTEEGRKALLVALPSGYEPEIPVGPRGYVELAFLPEASTIPPAQMGVAGLRTTVAVTEAGKVICPANKESLVLAGGTLRETCTWTRAVTLPVSSEHNAALQGLWGRNTETVRRIILTASEGPFRGKKRDFPVTVTPAQTLKHPNWGVGAKITINSASMMNKGLEIIEAHYLYGLPLECIGALVHPQSLVHSLMELEDGPLMAQAGTPDMCISIAYCLAWSLCLDVGIPPLDLARPGALTFEEPDLHSFPCLELACRTIGKGSVLPVALNAANEAAVEVFLSGRIGFADIPGTIGRALDECPVLDPASLEAIETLDHETRLRVDP